MRSDGSYRLVQTDVAPASVAKGQPRKGYEGGVYDAATGVFRHDVKGWEEDAGSYVHKAEVTTGWPLGPPDSWVSMESGLQSVALALRSAGRTAVTTTLFRGRPAWVLTATGLLAIRDKSERTAVTIDKQPPAVRVQAWKDGVLQVEYTWRYVSRDAPVPEATFTKIPTEHMKITYSDAGFRRWSLARIAATPGYVVLLPTRLPAGYRLQRVAAAERSTTANEITEGRDVTALQYVRGFDGLTVTTRTVSDPEQAARFDPVEWETSYAELVTRDVTLTGGAFSGATARVVVAPGIMVPHLYAVKGKVMLTVVGAATAQELVSIADSLYRYPAGEASPGVPQRPLTPVVESRAGPSHVGGSRRLTENRGERSRRRSLVGACGSGTSESPDAPDVDQLRAELGEARASGPQRPSTAWTRPRRPRLDESPSRSRQGPRSHVQPPRPLLFTVVSAPVDGHRRLTSRRGFPCLAEGEESTSSPQIIGGPRRVRTGDLRRANANTIVLVDTSQCR